MVVTRGVVTTALAFASGAALLVPALLPETADSSSQAVSYRIIPAARTPAAAFLKLIIVFLQTPEKTGLLYRVEKTLAYIIIP